jgi:hypothetical protein
MQDAYPIDLLPPFTLHLNTLVHYFITHLKARSHQLPFNSQANASIGRVLNIASNTHWVIIVEWFLSFISTVLKE